MRIVHLIESLTVFCFAAGVGFAAALDPSVPVFVKRYCVKCHNADSEKGDRNFEPFLANPGKTEHHEILKEMLDQLNLGEMPPRKKNIAQPPNGE
ncbi:hypothetical protein OAF00_01395, partial [bacterium]|nr:hypothetical protein [bacterium]